MAQQIVVELDEVEAQALKKLLEMGLFQTPQEALRIALLKYAMDLGGAVGGREGSAGEDPAEVMNTEEGQDGS